MEGCNQSWCNKIADHFWGELWTWTKKSRANSVASVAIYFMTPCSRKAASKIRFFDGHEICLCYWLAGTFENGCVSKWLCSLKLDAYEIGKSRVGKNSPFAFASARAGSQTRRWLESVNKNYPWLADSYCLTVFKLNIRSTYAGQLLRVSSRVLNLSLAPHEHRHLAMLGWVLRQSWHVLLASRLLGMEKHLACDTTVLHD